MPGDKRRAALRGQISAGVGRVDFLDEQILDIGGRRREAPGDVVVVADHDERHPGRGGAGDLAARRFRRARYHGPGAPKARCGSLASSGLPLCCAGRRRPSCSTRNAARPPSAARRRAGGARAGDRSAASRRALSARLSDIPDRERRGRRARSSAPSRRAAIRRDNCLDLQRHQLAPGKAVGLTAMARAKSAAAGIRAATRRDG